MKIAWIRIKGFQQFEDTFIDFRHPESGKALDKICLIGRNGTGKSTILQLIHSCFLKDGFRFNLSTNLCAVKIEVNSKSFILVLTRLINPEAGYRYAFLYDSAIESIDEWFEDLFKHSKVGNALAYFNSESQTKIESPFHKHQIRDDSPLDLENNNSDLLLYCPAESSYNDLIGISDVPAVNLDEALEMFRSLPFSHFVSNETITDFWRRLIYLIKKREDDRSEYENDSKNIEKTKKQLIEEFDSMNPDILKVITELWNVILKKAGLKFDYKNAKKPIQLTDNLKAYIVDENGTRVNYNKLSTGVRNFIFRFGHIKTLYFNREIKRGLLLVDEPENSLFPDFLLNIIEQYEMVTTDKIGKRNTQMFFATHSPIIAAQFEPHERIILDWDEDGSVKARKGTAPEGDDPNDILYQDFGMTEIVSKKGQEVWKAYLDLKKKLSREKNDNEKKKIAEEILKIGREYNFD
jgi:predicted ATP-dependent endonuclease of OLD family